MLATLSANKERMAGCMKLPRGEGGSGRGGDEPSAGLDRVLKKRGLSRKRAQEKKCKREKAFRLPKLFSSTKTESRNSRLPTCGEEQVEGKNLFRGGSRSSRVFFSCIFFSAFSTKEKPKTSYQPAAAAAATAMLQPRRPRRRGKKRPPKRRAGRGSRSISSRRRRDGCSRGRGRSAQRRRRAGRRRGELPLEDPTKLPLPPPLRCGGGS